MSNGPPTRPSTVTGSAPGTTFHAARRIGAGGMAEVLLAARRGPGGFAKLVVIKRLLPRLRDDASFVEMFLTEARLAASLSHPHIVEIHDIVRDADQFALVMEYLSGENLGYLIKAARRTGRPIPVGVVVRLAARVAAALDAAHGARTSDGAPRPIIHRDISPSNIMVTYDGYAKVVDFGVAKAVEHEQRTRPGAIKGKLAYLPPEQLRGHENDARSDLFSLGAVIHESLTGLRLFAGKSDAATVHNILEQPIPPPSAENPQVPGALDDLVLEMLARDRERRTPSAMAVFQRLEVIDRALGGTDERLIANWMADLIPRQIEARRAMEREIVREAQDVTTTLAGAALDPLPPGMAESGSAPGVASQSQVSSASSAAGPPPAQHRASTSSYGASPANPTSAGGAGQPGPHQSWSAPSMAPIGSGPSNMSAPSLPDALSVGPPARRAGGSTLSIVAAVLAALALGVALSRPWGASRAPDHAAVSAPAVASGPAASAGPPADRTPPAQAMAALRLHVVPEAADVSIDGAPLAQSPGPDGLLIPVHPERTIELTVTEPGYESHTARLQTPRGGVMPVYVTLMTSEPAATGDETGAETPAEDREAVADRDEDARETSRRDRAQRARRRARRRESPARPAARVEELAEEERGPAAPAAPSPEVQSPVPPPREAPPRPVEPPPPTTPVVVGAREMTRIRGELPTIRLRADEESHLPATTRPISTRICVDAAGAVTTFEILTEMPSKMRDILRRAIAGWRYRPHRVGGTAVQACFKTTFTLPIQRG